jgi:rfaE bifunctional protein nucleotidyltransferase chain/domain
MADNNNLPERVFQARETQRIDQVVSTLPRPLVFTNGCFDILHRGHVSYLETAAGLGASLVVGVNSDESVQSLGKDSSRPFNGLDDRLAVLAALRCIDAVIAFNEDTPLQLILKVHPDILVKGGDWAIPDIVGGREVSEWGGAVHSIEFEYDRSTSGLIDRIRS